MFLIHQRMMLISALMIVFVCGANSLKDFKCMTIAFDVTKNCIEAFQKVQAKVTKVSGKRPEYFKGSFAQIQMCKGLRNYDDCFRRGKRRLYGCNNETMSSINGYINGKSDPSRPFRKTIKCSRSTWNTGDPFLMGALCSLLVLYRHLVGRI